MSETGSEISVDAPVSAYLTENASNIYLDPSRYARKYIGSVYTRTVVPSVVDKLNFEPIFTDEFQNELDKNRSKDGLFYVFYTELYKSWQVNTIQIDQSISLFSRSPVNLILIHLVNPLVCAIKILINLYGFVNVKFIGLFNAPSLDFPGASLTLFNSHSSFFSVAEKIKNQMCFKDCKCIELDAKLLVEEWQTVYLYLLGYEPCYRNYTSVLLSRSYTNCFLSLFKFFENKIFFDKKFAKTKLETILLKLNKLLKHFTSIINSDLMDNCLNLPHIIFYCYLYGLLSIPFGLTPWDGMLLSKKNRLVDFINWLFPGRNDSAESSSANVSFAQAAADSACIDSARRRPTLMFYILSSLNEGDNWLMRRELHEGDAVDTYKLNLAWYIRPCCCTSTQFEYSKVWSIGLISYRYRCSVIANYWLAWTLQNYDAWRENPLWSVGASHVRDENQACLTCLKRIVNLRVRDATYNFQRLERVLNRGFRKWAGDKKTMPTTSIY